jgi:hypothetical protein
MQMPRNPRQRAGLSIRARYPTERLAACRPRSPPRPASLPGKQSPCATQAGPAQAPAARNHPPIPMPHAPMPAASDYTRECLLPRHQAGRLYSCSYKPHHLHPLPAATVRAALPTTSASSLGMNRVPPSMEPPAPAQPSRPSRSALKTKGNALAAGRRAGGQPGNVTHVPPCRTKRRAQPSRPSRSSRSMLHKLPVTARGYASTHHSLDLGTLPRATAPPQQAHQSQAPAASRSCGVARKTHENLESHATTPPRRSPLYPPCHHATPPLMLVQATLPPPPNPHPVPTATIRAARAVPPAPPACAWWRVTAPSHRQPSPLPRAAPHGTNSHALYISISAPDPSSALTPPCNTLLQVWQPLP